MNRKQFISTSATMFAGFSLLKLSTASSYLTSLPEDGNLMPVLFVGHGNPMNAIEDNAYTKGWEELAKNTPKPKAILCISAHWETQGTKVLAVEKPKLIYDMYGFPKELYEVKYPCDGAPELAREVITMVKKTAVVEDHTWGLDHGTWSVLKKMYPNADVPCFQMSLDNRRDLQYHYDLAKELASLRKKGVLIIGSGNIVHNLRYARFDMEKPYDWAVEFDEKIKDLVLNEDHKSIINYKQLGESAILSVNSAEHYIPLLYVLALQNKGEKLSFSNEQIAFGSGSMRCVKIG